MDLIRFLNNSNIYKAKIKVLNNSPKRVSLSFETLPDKEVFLNGFELINENNGKVMSSFLEEKYLYKLENDKTIILTDTNGDVWVEPTPKVKFIANNSCFLEGEIVQEVYSYEELDIPTPVAKENYKFEKWDPEIPEKGKIEKDVVFTAIFKYVPTEEELLAMLEANKNEKIEESKVLLADYLERHPLVSNCHGGVDATYTVTTDKQTLMASNYLTYTIAKNSGVENPVLTWNAAGCECEVWTEEEYVTLVLQIAEYVKPLVALQQSYEVQINACETQEELDSVNIVYDVYGASV